MKRPLLLGIDASRSTRSCPTGVERYSSEILQALFPELEDFEVRLYTPKVIAGFPREIQKVLWFPRLWSLVRLSWEMLWHKPDLLFVPAHVLPFFAPKRSFVTIHDVAFRKVPAAYDWRARWYLNWSTRRAVKKCEMVFVPTKSVAEDLKQFYGAKRVKVVPHGPLSVDQTTPVSCVPFETDPYFFYVGRIEEKKNLGLILDAWKIVQQKYPKVYCVLAGAPGNAYEALKARIEEENLHVNLRGYISEAEMVLYFRQATGFLFPSLEEGFGFPVLSAFEANCPVICSDIPALREVAGNAALYVGVHDAEGLAREVLQLLEKPTLRERLAEAGSERLREFSWKKAAEKLSSVFRQ